MKFSVNLRYESQAENVSPLSHKTVHIWLHIWSIINEYTSNEKNLHEQKFSFHRFFVIFRRNDWWLCSFLDVKVYIHLTYDQYLRVLKAWEVWCNGGQLGPTDLYWVDSNSQKVDEKVKFLGKYS